MKLEDKAILGMLGDADDVSILKRPDGFTLEVTSMYDAPAISLEMLVNLSDYFGTRKVDIEKDGISQGGCETCDYGSAYGHAIVITEPTKNVPVISE